MKGYKKRTYGRINPHLPSVEKLLYIWGCTICKREVATKTEWGQHLSCYKQGGHLERLRQADPEGPNPLTELMLELRGSDA